MEQCIYNGFRSSGPSELWVVGPCVGSPRLQIDFIPLFCSQELFERVK